MKHIDRGIYETLRGFLPLNAVKTTNPFEVIYCVGGGASLSSFDWGRLRGKRVIAVNRAFEKLPDAEVVYFTDKRFLDWAADGTIGNLFQHKGRKITVARNAEGADIEKWKLTGMHGLDLSPGCLRSGNNSGYTAINLAVHLGAKLVVLLGYDMKAPEEEEKKEGPYMDKVHWHNGYPVKVRKEAYQNKMLPYFDKRLLGDLDKAGVAVVNANPDSRLECFIKVPIDAVC